jgi:hypothetical protein
MEVLVVYFVVTVYYKMKAKICTLLLVDAGAEDTNVEV